MKGRHFDLARVPAEFLNDEDPYVAGIIASMAMHGSADAFFAAQVRRAGIDYLPADEEGI